MVQSPRGGFSGERRTSLLIARIKDNIAVLIVNSSSVMSFIVIALGPEMK
jgi:hypothetical protein